MPLGTLLKKEFNLTPHTLSIVISSYAIASFFSSFLTSSYIDKYDRKNVLMLGYGGFIAATFACSFANSFEMLLGARIVAGLFGGLIGSQIISIVSDLIPSERRGYAMGMLMGAFGAASILGIPFALKLSEYGWNLPFMVLSVLSLIVLIITMYNLPSMDKHLNEETVIEKNPFSLFYSVVKDKNQRMALIMNVVLMFSHFSVMSLMSPFMVSNVGFSESDIKYIYFFGGIMSLVCGPIIGKLADKYGKFKVFSFFAIIAIVPKIVITNLDNTPFVIALIITSIFFIISSGRIIPSQALMSTVVESNVRGGFMSINSSLKQLSSGAAAYFSGFVVTETATGELLNFHYVGYIGSALSLLCIILGSKLVERA
jgi:predicted MFS family arabinose efflux permease